MLEMRDCSEQFVHISTCMFIFLSAFPLLSHCTQGARDYSLISVIDQEIVHTMGSNLWPTLIRILFPVPATFLFLVCLPLPSRGKQSITRWMLKVFDKIFTFRIGFPLIYLIITASTALFLVMCLETYGFRAREVQTQDFTEKMHLRGRRWRAERNFYISLMSLIFAVLANRIRLLLKEMEELREQVKELRVR